MIVLPNMGLVKWDSLADYFSHEQLGANFEALDGHNHTAGKGVQIPFGGLAEQSVGLANLKEDIANAINTNYVLAGEVPSTGSATKLSANVAVSKTATGTYKIVLSEIHSREPVLIVSTAKNAVSEVSLVSETSTKAEFQVKFSVDSAFSFLVKLI